MFQFAGQCRTIIIALPAVHRLILFDFDSDRISVKLSVRQLWERGRDQVLIPPPKSRGTLGGVGVGVGAGNVGSLTKSKFRWRPRAGH